MNMTNKDTIIKTLQYIEENLKNEITVMEIAREGCYSLYHFIRLFQSITGFSPSKYLLQRRLTESAKELVKANKRISTLAYDYQFGSHESYTRAFRKQFGISPSELRNGKSLNSLSLLNPLTVDFIYQSEKVRNVPPVLVDLPETVLAGFSFFMPNDTRINDLSREWGQFLKETRFVKHKLTPEKYYQVQFWSENQDLGGLYFYLGVEITKTKNLNPCFVIKHIPAGTYLRFIHKGLANKVGYTYKYIYNQYLPDTEYILNKPFNFEYYGEKCLGPYNEKSESEIYIPVNLPAI